MSPPTIRRLVILTEGQWHVHNAKTATGVIRYGNDQVVALLDSSIAGRNVGEWLPGHDIPAVGSLAEALAIEPRPDALLIGIAPTGGRLPAGLAGDDPRGDRRRARRPVGPPHLHR